MVRASLVAALSLLHEDAPADTIFSAVCSSGLDVTGFSAELRAALVQLDEAAKRCIEKLSNKELKCLCNLGIDLLSMGKRLEMVERQHDEEQESMQKFWETICQTSIGVQKPPDFDLQSGKWLGNGHWGWIMRTRRMSDNEEIVVKMSAIKNAVTAAREWQHGSAIACDHIVEYQSICCLRDAQKQLDGKLRAGHEEGVLHSPGKRLAFPEFFICITEEFMNRGTVQKWIDQECLLPSGMLAVLRSVAAALEALHKAAIAHNDVKPENIMFHELAGKVTVKLGDLGTSQPLRDGESPSNDFWQYGMTGVCMVTGEKFGSRKYQKERVSEFVADVSSCVMDCGETGALANALEDLPVLLQAVFDMKVTMWQVKERSSLASWEVLAVAEH
mmetsp:Transcript_43731/g.100975  ORF Transcript_43731/g.100975 Transcript_43731/m.100975 type:complete len:388 (+) Transcript_43731:49-1212(+)